MTVFRIPATTTDEPKEPIHWRAGERTDIWPDAQPATIACGGEGRADYAQDKVTCPECLCAVARRRCLAMEPAPGPLPRRCLLLVHGEDEGHDWEHDEVSPANDARRLAQKLGADSAAASAEREAITRRQDEVAQHPGLDTPSGLLPVRVPGAALGDADEAWETSDGTAMSALHQALAEEAEERTDGDALVIERWVG